MTRRKPICLRPDDSSYPRSLVQRLGHSAPALYCCGNLEPALPRLLAIVGTRGATLAAVAATTDLAKVACREHGFGIVSGGALGIDAAAHQGAIDAGGTTIAVLGSGLRQLYPQRNIPLFHKISAGPGALLTPFQADEPPRRGHFIARNGLVAALAEAVLVTEAPLKSGALNTARQARALDIPVLAVAGSPGTSALIASGATEVRSADDLQPALSGRLPRGPREPDNSDDRAVLSALATDGSMQMMDALAERLAMSVPRVAAALVRLEVDGWVQSRGGGYSRAAAQ